MFGRPTEVAWLAITLGIAATTACGVEPELEPLGDPAAIRAARQTSSRLDYVAADYQLAVSGGAITDQREYDEQLEYLDEAAELGKDLPGFDVAGEVEAIIKLVMAKAPPAEVTGAASALAQRVLDGHRVVLAPLGDPDNERAASLFRENCAKCHGARGAGDGRDAADLKIKPRSFLDAVTMNSMSPRRVFNALTDGIAKAEMPQFDLFSTDDRWSLSFYVMSLRFEGAAAKTPENAPRLTVEALANTRDVDLLEELGGDGEALAWARTTRPFITTQGPLARAQRALEQAIADHRAGRRAEAAARIDAILTDSFSAYRPALTSRASKLTRRIEGALYQLRAVIPGGASPALEQHALALRSDMRTAARTSRLISPHALAGAATLAALGWMIVLLFVGNEAARAMRVKKANLAIHLGWAVAAVAGLATLFAVNDGGELAAASSRHQVVAFLRILAAITALACVVILVRRLAIVVDNPAPTTAPLPYWVAGVSFVCTYGSVLEWSHHLGHLHAETGAATWLLAVVGVVAALALVAMLRLFLELARRGGPALTYGAVSILGIVAAVAIAGGSMRGLIEGGTVPAERLGSIRAELLGVFPLRWGGLAQLAIAGLGVAIAVWGVIAKRGER